jgi:Flp pilus assembly protein TadG
MSLRSRLQQLRKPAPARVRAFLGDTRGAAAVELAVITPVILSIFFGTAELAQGFAIDRKLTITARALSDLVGQATTISNADMTNIFTAANAIMTPYSASPLKARVTAVNIDGSGTATVGWADHSNWSVVGAPGAAVTIPAALRIPNTQIIWSEVQYGYTPPFAYYITGMLNLTEQFFARPRQSNTICRPEQSVTTCS